MDLPAILAKITGAVFLIWTLFSIYKHVRLQQKENSTRQEVQSVSEQILNNILLYLWLAFMLIFSTGMIVNN
jgi:glycerol uptake facilitator-like aquaporin